VLPLTHPYDDFADAHSLSTLSALLRAQFKSGIGRGQVAVSQRWVVSQALAMSSPSIDDVEALVIAQWNLRVARGEMTCASRDKYEQSLRRLCLHAKTMGSNDVGGLAHVVNRWINSPVLTPSGEQAKIGPASDATRRLRRSVARSTFEILRLLAVTELFPAIDLSLPASTPNYRDPVPSDANIRTLRVIADGSSNTRTPASVALSLSGLTVGEVGATRIGDIDLAQSMVFARGTLQVEARWLVIPGAWERRVLSERMDFLRESIFPGSSASDLYVAGSRDGRSPASGSAISTTVGQALAHLNTNKRMDGYTPGALQAWAGRRVHQLSSDLSEVARFLGVSSLDTAARIIGLNWQESADISAPYGYSLEVGEPR